MSEPIVIATYDPAWAVVFERKAREIFKVLSSRAARIEHVGSTSIPGTDAKPIVDIQVSVSSFEPFNGIRRPLEEIGLTYREDDWEQHRFFFDQVTHVHVCESGSEWERKHLLFRDYLRAHPGDTLRYVETKKRLALEFSDDRMGYTDAKAPIVAEILESADKWAVKTSSTIGL